MSNYAIYQPKNKAAEYSVWACNFYVGCSNGCEYCYCKKGILAGVMGQDKPQLKKCFKDEVHAYETFKKELAINLDELREYGLFFSFTTDPMLPETKQLTLHSLIHCVINKVPVKILTKCVDWIDGDLINLIEIYENNCEHSVKSLIAFGFTLTGHDELEPGASTNAERIEAMKKLHDAGFKTFASIEPIIDFDSSMDMIADTRGFCDLYKTGLESGKKFNKAGLKSFLDWCCLNSNQYGGKIYFKDSLLKAAGIDRSELTENCVGRDYNIFKN